MPRPRPAAPPVPPAPAPRARGPVAARLRRILREWTVPVLFFLCVRTLFGQSMRIISGSMKPEMLVGDVLVVNQLAYGPVLPFVDVRLPGYTTPARGDIVVFVSPPQLDQPWDPTPTLVKRLVGVPGDTLVMRGGLLRVNGVARPNPGDASAPHLGADEAHPLFAWQRGRALHGSRFGEPPATPTHDDWGPLVVPAGHYFMLGDNRYESKDSRYWGLVPAANIRGRAEFVYFSYNADDSDRALPVLTDIRWSRLGHVYH